MTAVRVLAVTAERKIRLVRQAGQQREQALCRGFPHLAPIALGKSGPTLRGERLGDRIFDQLRARRQIRKPEIEVVAPSVILLANAPGRTPDRTQAKALPCGSRGSQTHYPD